MFDIVLFQPQIPPNTGNIIRLCANSGASLHLIEPLGFDLDEKSLPARRDLTIMEWHRSADGRFDSYFGTCTPTNLWAVTKFGTTRFDTAKIQKGDALLFGNEQNGHLIHLNAQLPQRINSIFLCSRALEV